ncbi:MAG: hypothetical protein M1826_007143 [Phylliscum demangeonii]|nr:MAG: hypothetical protein M1826_007143 [Phylliscum demangeonii]
MDEVFNNRYRVIRKLGRQGYAVLKIVRADSSEASDELSIMTMLDDHRASAAGAAHVIELQDSFTHQGPNGTHLCLVFEVMGASLRVMGEELAYLRNPIVPGPPQTSDEDCLRFPVWMTKVMLRQVLLALEFLHRNDIVHADLQPGNILCSVSLHGVPEERLRQDYHSADDPEVERNTFGGNAVHSDPVRRRDGKLDRWAPPHLTYDRPLVSYVRLEPKPNVKLSDLGAAFRLSDPPQKPVTPAGLRAPELILGGPFDQSIDIWSLGCLAFEFVTGDQLFSLWSWGFTKQEMDENHLLAMTAILGHLPEPLFQKWARADRHFGPDRKLLKSTTRVSGLNEEKEPENDNPKLGELFHEHRPAEMSEDEQRPFIAFLHDLLQYDPSKRPSASDLLQHPWLALHDPE